MNKYRLQEALKVRHFAVAVVIFGALVLQGCSMINPYVEWGSLSAQDPANPTLSEAIKYAQDAKKAYRKKLAAHAKMTNRTAVGMIFSGAAALGLATYGAHADALAGVGLAGGTGYTLAKWFSNDIRERIYAEGMKAMNCAVEAVLPLNFPEGKQQKANKTKEGGKSGFEDDLESLKSQIDSVQQAILRVKELRKKGKAGTDDAQAADAAVAEAEQIVETANLAYIAGKSLHRQIQTSGSKLVVSVDRIGSAVDDAIRQSQPKLEALSNIISQLYAATKIFAVPTDDKADDKADDTLAVLNNQSLKVAVRTLRSESLKLDTTALHVSAIVNEVNKKQPITMLKKCDVNVTTDISVSPARIQMKAKTASEAKIIVKGGKSPYFARFLSSPPKKDSLTVEDPFPPGDHAITINATAEVGAGEYVLYIADTIGHSKTVTVSVVK